VLESWVGEDAEEEPAGEGEAAGGVERHGGEPQGLVRGAGAERPPCTHLLPLTASEEGQTEGQLAICGKQGQG
jgi:hypothetical protein